MNENFESNILVLVLSNGDQILAEVEEHNGAYVCSNAMQILTRGDESTGQMSMGMVPYLPFTDGEIAIPTHMAILAIPNKELTRHYNKTFGSGIITPPEQKIFLG